MSRRSVILLAIYATVATVSQASPIPEPTIIHGDQRSYGEAQQFLVLHPQVVAPQLSSLKYEQPIIAPITQLGHISTPKEQLYFFYPSSPLSQAPLVSFQRDDGEEFNLINFISNWFASKPAEAAAPVPEAPPAAPIAQPAPAIEAGQAAASPAAQQPAEDQNLLSVGEEQRPVLFADQIPAFPQLQQPSAKPEKIEINPDAEFIPQTPQPQPGPPPQPAYAPFPLVPQLPDRRVYIVSGQPQFFGNFDAFANPLNPIFSLQPLSAIIPRSKEETKIEAVEEETVPASDAAAKTDVVVTPPVADLKIAPEVQAQMVETPVDVFARSNSRIELIPSDVDGAFAKEKNLSEEEKRIQESIQNKSVGGEL